MLMLVHNEYFEVLAIVLKFGDNTHKPTCKLQQKLDHNIRFNDHCSPLFLNICIEVSGSGQIQNSANILRSKKMPFHHPISKLCFVKSLTKEAFLNYSNRAQNHAKKYELSSPFDPGTVKKLKLNPVK